MEDQRVKALTQFEHARKRVHMYLGSPNSETFKFPIFDKDVLVEKEIDYAPAMLTAFREALDNSLDEMSFCLKDNKFKGRIDVTYDEANKIIGVSDNGRGIPIDFDSELGTYIATAAVSQTKVGRNFDERGTVAGTNGLGIAIVNMTSEFFDITVKRDDKVFEQNFCRGDRDLQISEPIIRDEKTGKGHGTEIRFKLSDDVFVGTLPVSIVFSLIRQIALSQPRISFWFNGKQIKFRKSYSQELFKSDLTEINIESEEEKASCKFVIAPSERQSNFTLVNNIPAINGGTHIDALKGQIVRGLQEALKRESNKRRLHPSREDILSCCFIHAVIKMEAPDFDSQSKTRLVNPSIFKMINSNFADYNWKEFSNNNADLIEKIYEKCKSRTGWKDRVEIDRHAKKLKKMKIPSLSDASSRDRKNCTLAIFEGYSAQGQYLSVRDPDFHACMPIRGKLANVWNSTPKDAIKSVVINDICIATGLAPGKPVDIESLRFGQVQFYTDQDEDGNHIRAALTALFYRFWPELFDETWLLENNNGKPFVVFAQTPLIVIEKKNNRKYFYSGDEFNMDKWKSDGWKFVMRAKGLAALETVHWTDHVNDKNSKIPIYDQNGKLGEILDVWFSGDSVPRKEVLEGKREF